MLSEAQLPQLFSDHLVDVVEEHLSMLCILAERCTTIALSGRRNRDGQLCDHLATLDDYRLDAKYCAGMVTRLCTVLRSWVSKKEWAELPYSCLPNNPQDLASWAWDNPWKSLRVVEAELERANLSWQEFYLRFSEKERRALVYTIGCRMTAWEAADKMGVSRRTIQNIIHRAQMKFGPRTPVSQKPEENHL